MYSMYRVHRGQGKLGGRQPKDDFKITDDSGGEGEEGGERELWLKIFNFYTKNSKKKKFNLSI